MAQENVNAARGAVDGWNRGDIEAWLEPCHPQVEWFSAIKSRVEGVQTVYRGHAEMRRFWEEWHSLWDLTIEVSEFRDLGDTVLALGRIRTRGDVSRMDLESPVGYVFNFENGLIRRIRAYLDRQQALHAVGLRE